MAIKKESKVKSTVASKKPASKSAKKPAVKKSVCKKETCKSTCAKKVTPVISLLVTHNYDYFSSGFKRASSRSLKFESYSKKGATEYISLCPRVNRRLTGRVISAAISLNAKSFDIKQEIYGKKGYKVTVSSGKKSVEIITKTKIFDI